MIKSSKLSIKEANKVKNNDLQNFIKEYQKVCQYFIDITWEMSDIQPLLGKEITQKAQTWLSQRAIQCAAKQASAIVRGTRTKQKQREHKYKELISKGMFKKARKLKKIIDEQKTSKPSLSTIEPELDSRFVKMDFSNDTSFDGWLTLSSLGNKLKIQLPVKKTKHFNMLHSKGSLKSGVRISAHKVTFMFDMPDVAKKDVGVTIGLDIGVKNVFSTSDYQHSKEDNHGWTLDKIQQRLSRRKKGSKGFERAQELRKNYIHWSINRLNLNGVKHLRLEDIRSLRKGSKSSRFLSHWTYTIIYDKLESYSYDHGVHVIRVDPTYTSQRCSKCGWVRKSNRKGKTFKCTSCGFVLDADLNASRNIALELPVISREQRLLRSNRNGFYWNCSISGIYSS